MRLALRLTSAQSSPQAEVGYAGGRSTAANHLAHATTKRGFAVCTVTVKNKFRVKTLSSKWTQLRA